MYQVHIYLLISFFLLYIYEHFVSMVTKSYFVLLGHGGGWGYNAGSVEAIRFSPDQDVLLGGFGLYGGRGSYNAEIKVSILL